MTDFSPEKVVRPAWLPVPASQNGPQREPVRRYRARPVSVSHSALPLSGLPSLLGP